MQKRGQLTVFIVVGLLLVALLVGFFAMQSSVTQKGLEPQIPQDVSAIKLFVDGCLMEATTQAVRDVAWNGGYMTPPELVFTQEDDIVPYYFKDETRHDVLLEFIADEVSREAESLFIECINDFTTFEDQGFTMLFENPHIDITFTPGVTTSELTFPLTIIKVEAVTTLSQFVVEHALDFHTLHTMMQEYLTKQEQDSSYFLVGDLSSLALQHDVRMQFTQFGESGEDVVLELIVDEEEPIIYRVATQFTWDLGQVDLPEVLVDENKLRLLPFDPWIITKPGIATFQIPAKGEGLKYIVDPDSLTADTNGLITLDTTDFHNNEHLYYIRVTDQFDNVVDAPLLIELNVNDGTRPVIAPIGRHTVKVGDEFKYRVLVENQEGVTFESESVLFDIDSETGVFSFTPEPHDRGIHSVRIIATNEFGSTWQRFIIEVEK